ncbi:MAG: TonB-dependent receptor [Bacteroidales bacterium]|nr:TonB-dependent receptor [Bacteroidales bacterium]
MKKIGFILISLFFVVFAYSQKATISGTVTDFSTRETMVGVNIILGESLGITTDIDGKYSIDVDPGRYVIEYKFVGYKSRKRIERVEAGQRYTINVRMEEETQLLSEVVVSAGKFEQNVEEVTVSMDVIRANVIENNNTLRLETALQKVPSIVMMDGQASIRGGSGYSFGAGSRVMMLVDDLPMMAGASGLALWDYAPVENIDQVEIIKGASSALYGSSALNGVINIRTKYPSLKPETKLIMTSGFYDNPIRKEIRWWPDDEQPVFTSMQFMHSRMIGNFDLVVGGNILSDEGYRETESRQSGRINFNTRWRSKKVQGLSFGVNANYMNFQGGRFMMWENGWDGLLKAAPAYKNYSVNNSRLNVDPYITYFSSVGNRHSLKTRYYETKNDNSTNQQNNDEIYYAEYQYQKYMEDNLTWTSGVSAHYLESTATIYGAEKHVGAGAAIYSQLDKKIKKFTTSVGARWEANRLNQDKSEGRPVFRTGLNYSLFEHTNLRASFGQGYRFPTITEKYIHSNAGQLNIFPNDTLKPESGWSAEIGLRQGFAISNWIGFIDISGFWTEYYDMIEFSFGYHFPDYLQNLPFYHPDSVFKYVGFKAINVSNARITGIDVNIGGQGSIFGVPVSLLGGYTYTDPIDLNISPEERRKNTKQSNMLKYRFNHTFKADAEMNIKNIYFGVSYIYFSHMINIDKAFEDTLRFPDRTVNGVVIPGQPIQYASGDYAFILPGLKEYREQHNKGYYVLDFRLGIELPNNSRVSIIAKNVLNNEYMIRPADIQPPRTFAVQYLMRL